MQTPDWVTADDLSGGGTLSREITTSIGEESTAAETRASTSVATTIKTLKLSDPGKSIVQPTEMEVESDRDDARERRRRVREDKLRIESGRRGGKSKSLTLRTGGTTDDGEELSDAVERSENRYSGTRSGVRVAEETSRARTPARQGTDGYDNNDTRNKTQKETERVSRFVPITNFGTMSEMRYPVTRSAARAAREETGESHPLAPRGTATLSLIHI